MEDTTKDIAVNGLRFLAAKLAQCERVEDFVLLSSRDSHEIAEEHYGQPYFASRPRDNEVTVKLEITFRTRRVAG